MLSDARRKRRPRPPAPLKAAPVALGATLGFEIAGVPVEAQPEGALWLGEMRALIVSDLHLEKGSSFAVRGQMIPPYDTRATLKRIEAVMARLAPDIVISLGDGFHDRGGPFRMGPEDRAQLRTLVERVDWVWIEGNHDPEIPAALGGRSLDVLSLGALTLRHEPTEASAPGEIAGHLHPCARVASRGRSVRARCFATDGSRLVMPAFGAYTGGLNLCDEAFAPVFPHGANALLLGRGRVYPAMASRLIPDA
ncbi:MAG: ligase-associated DNA damage response endonuclease PdeM [Hyphomonadaceae bacterium]